MSILPVLNGQNSLLGVFSRSTAGFCSGILVFLICINDLATNLNVM